MSFPRSRFLSLWGRMGNNGWSPLDLGDKLHAWWDAEVSASLTLSGSNVTTWADRKAGIAITQASSGFKPTYGATSFSSRPGVTFDGTDDYLSFAGQPFPTAGGADVWVLADSESVAGTRRVVSFGGTTTASAIQMGHLADNKPVAQVGDGATGVVVQLETPLFDAPALLRCNIGAAETVIQLNDTASAPVAVVPAFGTSVVTIGAVAIPGLTRFWYGAVNSVIVTDPLTTEEEALLTAYLKSRGGIA